MHSKLKKNKNKKISPKSKVKTLKNASIGNKPGKSIERYELNKNFIFYDELKKLILKPSPSERLDMVSRINKIGKVKLAVIAGILLDDSNQNSDTADLLIVADAVDRARFTRLLKWIEANVGKEIKFALMDSEEFRYRSGMFDRFIRVLFDEPHEKLIEKIGI